VRAYSGDVATTPNELARDRIVALSRNPTDLVTFWRDVTEVLRRTIPHYLTPCWYTLDPASLLTTSHYQDGLPEFPREWLANEYYTDDVNKIVDIVRSATGISTLHEATGGDPSESIRWHATRKMGGDQELLLRLRTRSGEVWGVLGLYREPGAPFFDSEDKAFLVSIGPHLAEGARRALLIGEATDPQSPDAPGLLILSRDWDVLSTTPGVERWLATLPDGEWGSGQLPSAVLSVAGRALRRTENRAAASEVAMARVMNASGEWLVLHGAVLASGGDARVAVIIEPAHPARIYPLLMAAYELTERERDVTRLVLQGSSTAQIAGALVVTQQTVQQHLKGIFDKTGVRSRRDLVGKIFFTHYEPRFRDNERRVTSDKPVRGGPAQA
jgi:DNA-binding CsgD family transcriptional regulator